MTLPKLTRLEMSIMDALWNNGPLAIREIQEAFPAKKQPTYTTIQTTVYRLEAKGVLRRKRKIGNAHIFEALVTREAARGRLIDDLLSIFGGRTLPMMAHLVESGKLTAEDLRETDEMLRKLRTRKES